MSSTSFDDESLMPIITALHHNTTLANLSLREEAQAIFRPIRPTVRHLLPGQVASPAPPIECFTQAASELAAVVRSTRSLTKLHITVRASLSLSPFWHVSVSWFSQCQWYIAAVRGWCARSCASDCRQCFDSRVAHARTWCFVRRTASNSCSPDHQQSPPQPLSPITVQRLKESLENNYHLFRVCTPVRIHPFIHSSLTTCTRCLRR